MTPGCISDPIKYTFSNRLCVKFVFFHYSLTLITKGGIAPQILVGFFSRGRQKKNTEKNAEKKLKLNGNYIMVVTNAPVLLFLQIFTNQADADLKKSLLSLHKYD
jgi:hypothetical protein